MSDDIKIPKFVWAQDDTHIFVSVELPEPQDVKVDLKPESFHFHATSKGEKYGLDCELLKEIDVEASKYSQGRVYQFLLAKKDTQADFWPRLLKDKDAYKHQLSVDWELWRDPDESDDEDKERLDQMGGFQNIMQMMGGGGGGGMGGGMGGFPGMAGLEGLGGMGGMGGLEGFDMDSIPDLGAGDDDGDDNEDDDDDDDMPELEADDEKEDAKEEEDDAKSAE